MAAGTLPAPGSKVGPCKTDCNHRDCAITRCMAAAPCLCCRRPIGFECAFYQPFGPPERAWQADLSSWSQRLAHASCYEQAEEDARDLPKLIGTIALARIILLEQDPKAALADLLSDNPEAAAIVARLRGAT